MTDDLAVRGEIWWVNLDPTVGSEIKKIRPCLVLSSARLAHLPVRIVVPFTSWQQRFSNQLNRIFIPASASNGLDVDSAADVLQIRAAATERFGARLGVLSLIQLQEIGVRVALVLELETASDV